MSSAGPLSYIATCCIFYYKIFCASYLSKVGSFSRKIDSRSCNKYIILLQKCIGIFKAFLTFGYIINVVNVLRRDGGVHMLHSTYIPARGEGGGTPYYM